MGFGESICSIELNLIGTDNPAYKAEKIGTPLYLLCVQNFFNNCFQLIIFKFQFSVQKLKNLNTEAEQGSTLQHNVQLVQLA